MKILLFLPLFCSLVLLSSCTSTSEPERTPIFSISGIIDNPNHITLPKDATLVVAWFIVGGHSGYVYTYGDADINTSNNTFSVKFTDKPPKEALYETGAGIAYIALLNSIIPKNGIVLDFPPTLKFYGRVDSAAVIYIKDSTLFDTNDWIGKFSNGYTFSAAVFVDNGYDYFVPTAPPQAILRIDTTITNFSSVNWY